MGKGKFSIENKFNKYSFIQHACSYSPFVDFTKSPIIAASFALSNVSKLNDFINHDACIICMKFGNEDKTKLITDKSEARLFIKNEMRLDIIDSDTFVFGKNYEIAKSNGSIKKICYYTFDELLSRLSPDYKILDIQTNDRMTYQKGLFICFYGCLCLREFIAYELCPDLYLTKIYIKTGNKRSILEDIYKHYRQYDPEHLLDPYLYFNE